MRTITLFLLLLLVSPTYGLTSGEEGAIADILESFPHLREESPPWNYNVSLACDEPPFYGLTCSNGPDPHVLKMYGLLLFRALLLHFSPLFILLSICFLDLTRNVGVPYHLISEFSGPSITGTLPDSVGQLSWLETLYVPNVQFLSSKLSHFLSFHHILLVPPINMMFF